jgi:hypothetical protein
VAANTAPPVVQDIFCVAVHVLRENGAHCKPYGLDVADRKVRRRWGGQVGGVWLRWFCSRFLLQQMRKSVAEYVGPCPLKSRDIERTLCNGRRSKTTNIAAPL